MTNPKLPEKVIPISMLRIRRDKLAKCRCRNRKFEVDVNNQEVLCAECGVIIPAYEALLEIALDGERLVSETQNLLDERKRLENWKPHLLSLRRVEATYKGGMLPCCPHCGNGILAEELSVSSVNKQLEIEKRRFELRNKE